MGESPSERRAAGRPPRSRDGGQAGGDEQDSADDHAHAGQVGERRTGVHDVKAVRDDAESHRQQPDDDAEDESRGARDVRLGEPPRRPGSRRSRAPRGVRCPDRRRRGRAGGRRPGPARRAGAGVRAVPRGRGAGRPAAWRAIGRSSVRVAVMSASLAPARRPARHGGRQASGARRVARRWGQPYLASRGARRQDGHMTARRTLAIAAAALLCGVGDVLLVARQRALPRSRGVGRVRPRGRVELRGHGPVRLAPPAGVALRALDGPGGVRVVPRAAVRLRRAARVHGRHRAQRSLGPRLRPSPAELPDRTAAHAGATPARGGQLRADPARAGAGAAGQRRRRGDHRLPRRMPAQRAAHLGRSGPPRRRAGLRLGGDARPLPRGGRHAGAPVARRRRARAPEPRPAVRRRRAHARAHRRLRGDARWTRCCGWRSRPSPRRRSPSSPASRAPTSRARAACGS